MFLENEGWELCPVKTNFSILQLQVYLYIKKIYHDLQELTQKQMVYHVVAYFNSL